MRKIDSKYENPIDNILLKLCDKLIDICVKLNITPNMITLFRIILSVYIIYLLYYTDNIKLLFILIVIFHFLDCMDGHLARSTNQFTKLGDYLDHFADTSLSFVIIIYMIIKKYPNKIIILTLLAFEIYMLNCHMGLQQAHYKKNNPNAPDETLDIFNKIHNFNLDAISYTRYFGPGTIWLIIILIIYYIKINI